MSNFACFLIILCIIFCGVAFLTQHYVCRIHPCHCGHWAIVVHAVSLLYGIPLYKCINGHLPTTPLMNTWAVSNFFCYYENYYPVYLFCCPLQKFLWGIYLRVKFICISLSLLNNAKLFPMSVASAVNKSFYHSTSLSIFGMFVSKCLCPPKIPTLIS